MNLLDKENESSINGCLNSKSSIFDKLISQTSNVKVRQTFLFVFHIEVLGLLLSITKRKYSLSESYIMDSKSVNTYNRREEFLCLIQLNTEFYFLCLMYYNNNEKIFVRVCFL